MLKYRIMDLIEDELILCNWTTRLSDSVFNKLYREVKRALGDTIITENNYNEVSEIVGEIVLQNKQGH